MIRRLFERHQSERLSAMIVWLPMRIRDNPGTAATQAATFVDDRLLLQGWDAEREIGTAFEKTLDLTRTAWDVYLVYEPGITWTDELPPKPSYWMHQLTEDAGANQDYCLNSVILDSEVAKRLEMTEG